MSRACRALREPLEDQFQRELDLPGSGHRARNHSPVWRYYRAAVGGNPGKCVEAARDCKIRMVRYIERLAPELQSSPLINRKGFRHREIDVGQAWASQRISPQIAALIGWLKHESVDVPVAV